MPAVFRMALEDLRVSHLNDRLSKKPSAGSEGHDFESRLVSDLELAIREVLVAALMSHPSFGLNLSLRRQPTGCPVV